VVEQSPSVELLLTLSQNPATLLLVGEARRGEQREVAIVPVEAPVTAAPPQRTAIAATRIWEQDTPFLDIASAENLTLVLESGRVAVYENGSLKSAVAIKSDTPLPRDLRGRLRVEGSEVAAWLPGMTCRGPLQPVSLLCESSNTAWPIAPGLSATIVPARNYFDGTVDSGRRAAPFFSAALVENRLLTAGLDGQVRIYADSPEPAATWTGWGDDIAGVSTACGRHVLTAEDGTVRVYEIVEGKPVAAGAPVELPGVTSALWEGADGRHAVAIILNDSSGRHEAFSLSITCSR
jgi:hypothetical protein